MKKLLIIALFFAASFVSAFEQSNIKTFTLENGMKIYFLQDSSSPTVRMELSIGAGFSSQNEKNAGYFALYANLINAKISQDDVSISKTVTPLEFEKTVLEFSDILKPLRISDGNLKKALNAAKKEMNEYASSAAGFINSSIDARIFAKEPWKKESGVSPSIFSAKSVSEARTVLQEIGNQYYTSDKATLFISGNLTENAAVSIVQQYFGDFLPSKITHSKTNAEKNIETAFKDGKIGKERKFVLYDKSFSDEMTQIVVEYKSFSKEKATLLSHVWNKDSSPFKKLLLKQKNLKIYGAEYIDSSAVMEKDGARIVIQSLMENSKVSPAVQAELFLTMSRDEENLSEDQFENSVKTMKSDFSRIKENSSKLMEDFKLFSLHCNSDNKAEAFFDFKECNFSGEDQIFSIEDFNRQIQEENPYIFVLVNSSVYAKCAKEFKNAGYTAVTSKNGAWFTQKIYLDAIKQKEEAKSPTGTNDDIADSAMRFIQKHKSEFSSFELKNGIPVTIKRNSDSNSALLSISIAGGDMLFADKTPGLTAVITDSIAFNIQKLLGIFAEQKVLNSYFEVSAQTFSTHSIINVSCAASELEYAVQAAYTVLVFYDISPAIADGVTYDERTQWRLKTGSGDFQLLCEAVRILYKDTDYPKLYKDSEDKPNEMSFTKIQEGYPILLDASRFSLILTGGLKDNEPVKQILETTFGTLSSQKETQIHSLSLPYPAFKKLSKKIQLRHLFLTDISKDKAGPMPAKLIPTTKFLDPVLYCMGSPDLDSTDAALFNALILELGRRIEEKASALNVQSKVKVGLPDPNLPFVRIVVTNVEKTSEIDRIYSDCVSSIKKDLKYFISLKTDDVIDVEKNELLSRLESNWIMEILGEAGSLEGTARLIENGSILNKPSLYLDQYAAVDSAELEDYFILAESLLDAKPPLILYSKDSK